MTEKPGFVPTNESMTGGQLEAATGGPHRYLSTGCLHAEHGYCAGETRADGGTKVPASCKFCGAGCVCPCHTAAS